MNNNLKQENIEITIDDNKITLITDNDEAKVKIINKTENFLDVCAKKENGKAQLIIEADSKTHLTFKSVEMELDFYIKDLSDLKPGTTFNLDNIEYIVLEHFDNGTTTVLRKKLLDKKMKFDSNKNNWKESSIRQFLNDEYLNEISNSFGEQNIIEHTVNLFSMDGLDDYGTAKDKVSLLTIDQYRKYRKIIGENMNDWWWLATPDSTPSGYDSDYVQYVGSSGSVSYGWCNYVRGVRPFLKLRSSICVSV